MAPPTYWKMFEAYLQNRRRNKILKKFRGDAWNELYDEKRSMNVLSRESILRSAIAADRLAASILPFNTYNRWFVSTIIDLCDSFGEKINKFGDFQFDIGWKRAINRDGTMLNVDFVETEIRCPKYDKVDCHKCAERHVFNQMVRQVSDVIRSDDQLRREIERFGFIHYSPRIDDVKNAARSVRQCCKLFGNRYLECACCRLKEQYDDIYDLQVVQAAMCNVWGKAPSFRFGRCDKCGNVVNSIWKKNVRLAYPMRDEWADHLVRWVSIDEKRRSQWVVYHTAFQRVTAVYGWAELKELQFLSNISQKLGDRINDDEIRAMEEQIQEHLRAMPSLWPVVGYRPPPPPTVEQATSAVESRYV